MNRAQGVSRKFVRYDTVRPIKKARFAISRVTPSAASDGINFLIALLHPRRYDYEFFIYPRSFCFYPARLLQGDRYCGLSESVVNTKLLLALKSIPDLCVHTITVYVWKRRGEEMLSRWVKLHKI